MVTIVVPYLGNQGAEVRVKDMKRLYGAAGYTFKRQGKGDHEIWHNERGEVQVFDGKDSDDIDKGLERAMLRRLKPKND